MAAEAEHRDASTVIRRHSPTIQASVANELLRGKVEARAVGHEEMQDAIDEDLPLIQASDADAASAFIAAAGLTAAWGAAALSASSAGSSLSRIARAVGPNIERTVATEIARSFNDERDALLFEIGELFDMRAERRGGDADRHPGMFKVFSAILDGRTCSECFGADGETVELQASFKAGTPPLHPRCRCLVEHVVVPMPERLEDIAIDYDLFKKELRDVIREDRIISQRQALNFVSDSLGSKRSPEVLSKRFREEPYATRKSP